MYEPQKNYRSHNVFMYLEGKPKLGMPLNMRNDDLDTYMVLGGSSKDGMLKCWILFHPVPQEKLKL